MKNTLFAMMALCSFFAFAQDDSDTDKHEIKTNVFNLIIFKAPEFTYEYLIDSESSVGASILFNLQDTEDDSFIDGPYFYERFAFTPYYRRFISGKYASRFFFEAFGMYNVQEDYDGVWSNDFQTITYTEDTSSNLAFGVAIGSKFVSSGGFLFEFYGGVGRNIITSDDDVANELVPRVGISLGYRF
ncbi:MAG: DUF3575 domain-containing protein [Pricia sp.]